MRPSEETKTDAVNQLKDLPSPASYFLPHHASPRLATEAASDRALAGAPRPAVQWTPEEVTVRIREMATPGIPQTGRVRGGGAPHAEKCGKTPEGPNGS